MVRTDVSPSQAFDVDTKLLRELHAFADAHPPPEATRTHRPRIGVDRQHGTRHRARGILGCDRPPPGIAHTGERDARLCRVLVVRGTQKLRSRVKGTSAPRTMCRLPPERLVRHGAVLASARSAARQPPHVSAALPGARSGRDAAGPCAGGDHGDPRRARRRRRLRPVGTRHDTRGADRANQRSQRGRRDERVRVPRQVLWQDGLRDLLVLSLRMADMPLGPLRDRAGSPDRELAAVLGAKDPTARVIPFPGRRDPADRPETARRAARRTS